MSEEENNEIVPDWRDSLPDDLKESATLKDVKDVSSLAKQFVDQSSYLGNAIRLPGEDATDEIRQEFRQRLLDKNVGLMETPNPDDPEAMNLIYKTLGRPDEVTGYTRPESGIDDARFSLLSSASHEAGISDKQFKSVVGKIIEADGKVMDALKSTQEAGLTALRDEWGGAYDSKVSKSAKLAELTGAPEGLIEAIKSGKVDSATLKWMDKLSNSIGGEQGEMISQGGGDKPGITKQEARERSAEIHKTLMDMNPSDPRYAGLIEKRLKYTEMYAG